MTTQRLSFEKYRALPGINASSLKDLLESPKAYRWRQQFPRDETEAMLLGRALHTSVLEPDRFALEYAVWPSENGPRRGKTFDAYVEANRGRTVLNEEQYSRAVAMRKATFAHPLARKLLAVGEAEVSVQFSAPDIGVELGKARIDWLAPGAIVDVKTSRDVSAHRFCADAARLHYGMQMAWYQLALSRSGYKALDCKIVAVQSCEPWDVVVYSLPDMVLAHGRDQYKAALKLLAECTASGVWPGQAEDEEVALTLPAWAIDSDDGEMMDFGAEVIA